MRSKFDKDGECLARGMKSQDLFEIISTQKGYSFANSSRSDDMSKHVDCWLTRGKLTFGVDVKAPKKINRTDEHVTLDWVWFELLNVQGRNGWLMGDAKYIAFQNSDNSFILADREELLHYIPTLVENETRVTSAGQAKYRYYQRRNRKDLITCIESKHLYEVGHMIWEYE